MNTEHFLLLEMLIGAVLITLQTMPIFLHTPTIDKLDLTDDTFWGDWSWR